MTGFQAHFGLFRHSNLSVKPYAVLLKGCIANPIDS